MRQTVDTAHSRLCPVLSEPVSGHPMEPGTTHLMVSLGLMVLGTMTPSLPSLRNATGRGRALAFRLRVSLRLVKPCTPKIVIPEPMTLTLNSAGKCLDLMIQRVWGCGGALETGWAKLPQGF